MWVVLIRGFLRYFYDFYRNYYNYKNYYFTVFMNLFIFCMKMLNSLYDHSYSDLYDYSDDYYWSDLYDYSDDHYYYLFYSLYHYTINIP